PLAPVPARAAGLRPYPGSAHGRPARAGATRRDGGRPPGHACRRLGHRALGPAARCRAGAGRARGHGPAAGGAWRSAAAHHAQRSVPAPPRGMTPAASRRPPWHLLGNGTALALLAACALWLLQLHDGPWFTPVPGPGRWLCAGAALLAWAGLAWRTSRRPAMLSPAPVPASAGTLLVACASQTGFALQLAERTAQSLRGAGCEVVLCELGRL